MKLIEALEILRAAAKADAPACKFFLASGFTPLHLTTFLAAELQQRLPTQVVRIETGTFGDLAGSLENLETGGLTGVAVAMEWPDLDPRLGARRLGGRGGDPEELLEASRSALARLEKRLAVIAGTLPVAISLPSLPLLPLSPVPGWQASALELGLSTSLSRFAEGLADAGARVVSAQRLAQLSPMAGRADLQSDLLAAFPYTRSHASELASLLAQILVPPLPLKGLITDLDGTLWSGILGEDGVAGVAWDLDHHAQRHGLYQQLLRNLADNGVLIAAATKNDAGLVAEALAQNDLLLSADRLYPVEANWGAKSASVGRILQAWNVGSDSVAFIDDSAMERAEVAAAHPGLLCLPFPERDDASLFDFLDRLRDLFGKPRVLDEDRLRRESLRSARVVREAAGDSAEAADRFLEQAEAQLELSFAADPSDARALELVNKTNQFNLNGRRFGEAAWREALARPGAFLLSAAYADKYGPLGKIAVMAGLRGATGVKVEVFVLSCRAFSRRIEHRLVERLLARFEAPEIAFDFASTRCNGPVRDFLAGLLGRAPESPASLRREDFLAKRPQLYHDVKER